MWMNLNPCASKVDDNDANRNRIDRDRARYEVRDRFISDSSRGAGKGLPPGDATVSPWR
jgi:hypothetical protein